VKKIYKELRNNLLSNIEKEWINEGYLFENYNSITGKGEMGKPFCGWTALIILIIEEKYF